MTTCLIPFSFDNADFIQYRFVPKISINCDINRDILCEIIQFSFIHHNGISSVFGYNSSNDEYSIKKTIKNEFLLHVTLSIKSIDYENSTIIVKPLIGSDKEIKNFVCYIKEIVNLYKSTNFIVEHFVDKI